MAELANLELTAAEEVSMLRDLNSILDHVAQLNELDTSSIPAMAQVSEILAGSNPLDRCIAKTRRGHASTAPW